jgi:hypothetical protein
MLGDELDDLRLDLSGFPFDSRWTVGECRGEEDERGKGTAFVFNLSRKGGRWS